MKKEQILYELKKLQPLYLEEGILLLGLFGSYANETQDSTSDVDILIETTPKFLKKYRGFKAFSRLDEIKNDLKKIFKKDIDLVDKVGLEQHNNNYILENTLYVS
jgi:predicted nucleotidyltransferase